LREILISDTEESEPHSEGTRNGTVEEEPRSRARCAGACVVVT
jgi:hypothetical protein